MTRIYAIFNLLGQKVKSKVSQKFLTYLFFLLIAVAIWYLNALNKDYTADFRFAVRYTDMPEGKILANTLPDYLFLTIQAQGFTLLRYRFRLMLTPIMLEASYNTMQRKNNSVQGKYFLSTQSMFGRIAAQLRSDVRLQQISPDTLHFHFTETISRNIPVKPAIQMQFEKGFLPTGNMLIEPARVIVTGPQTIIDTMQYVHTQSKVFRRLNSSLSAPINLLPVNQLRFSTNEVKITQAIERHTEATVVVPIEAINMPEGTTMRLFPGSVTVNCLVPISDYEKMQPHLFRAVVDYNYLKDITDNQAKARVALLRTPDFVVELRFHPYNVDFIIEK